jgi:hypothetical protein
MALISYFSYRVVEGRLPSNLFGRVIETAVPICLGVAVFLLGAVILRVPEVKTVFAGIGRKRNEVVKGS